MTTNMETMFTMGKKFSFLLLLLIAIACGESSDHEHDTYTCPMHPTVINDRPGSCPVCGMDLVRKARAGEEMEITKDLSRLLKSPNESVIASVQTTRGTYKTLYDHNNLQGIVSYDPRYSNAIAARISGRLEKLYVKYNLQHIARGERIAELYSPEILTAQRELISIIENDAANQQLIDNAKMKLRQLGASQEQIEQFTRSREPKSTFTIFSPYEGYATFTQILNTDSEQSSSQESQDMSSMNQTTKESLSENPSSTPTLTLREGDYINSGQVLFEVVDASRLRIDIKFASNQTSLVNIGDTVLLQFADGTSRTETIALVEPYTENGKEFQTARVYTRSSKLLQVGQPVTATIATPKKETLWIPETSVVDLGTRHVVFVKQKDVFKAREISIGLKASEMIQVTEGLTTMDEIASNAQFLVDSEGFIKVDKQ